MKSKIILCLCYCIVLVGANAQPLIKPGEGSIEKQWLKNSTYELACFSVNGQQWVPISSFTVKVQLDQKALNVYTTLTMAGSNEQWVDTSVSELSTLKPIYRSSHNPNRQFALHFGKAVTGYYLDKKTQQKTAVNEPVNGAFFDNYLYPYLLAALPLNSGYRANLAVYDYKPGNASHIKTTRIEEVKSSMYQSEMTGEHKAWQVSVLEEATNERYDYYIDKEHRKLWKIEIRAANGQRFVLLNKELDYNPFKTVFNKAETIKLIRDGNSVISGEAFARDNENEGLLKGVAVLNINKKQHAKMGTSILLIPYTPYFKEWIRLNEKLRKKGRSIPLAKEAAECIKTTTVYDNDGHFEFTNLMPGDYLLYTEFGYVHTSVRTQVVGYTDTYINGMFQGSSANTVSYRENSHAGASIRKTVTIKKDGEKLSVKLKKTL